MKKFDVDKYFRKNPVTPLFPVNQYHCAVVIPAFDELETISATLYSLQCAISRSPFKVAVIVVINYPPGADPAPSKELLHRINSGQYPGVTAIYLPENHGGVGRARKIGMDSFTASIAPEEMENSVIFSLDADTIVESDYITNIFPEAVKGGGVSIGFSHNKPDDPLHRDALGKYEAYLVRYVRKLQEAGSPYAFFTIGSAFAVRCDSYLRAGGMKQKLAGEDFYFLQAVAKSSCVRQLEQVLVHPSGRVSGRVPFGTGPAVEMLANGGKLNEIPDFAFEKLNSFLSIAADAERLANLEKLQQHLEKKMLDFLVKERFFERFKKSSKDLHNQPEKLLKSFHEWFDGLKTLKFLHFFSDLSKFDIDKKEF